ncbi:MAG TPA: hypothetical protein VGE69_00510 [Pseudomonadales bacterium]
MRRSRVRPLLLFAAFAVLPSTERVLAAPEASAAPMPPLQAAATDGGTYEARFALGLTIDAGISWQQSANLKQPVLIRGSVEPAAAHVGTMGDIFVVEWYAGRLSMLAADGTWQPWTGRIADLQPARDDVQLTARHELTLYEGSIAAAGRHQLYIGYMPANATTIVYSANGATFDVHSVTADARAWFTQQIFDTIVKPRCALCHAEGGVAGQSDLHFRREAGAGQNFDIFAAFYYEQADAYDYVLGKVSGGNAHGGGMQLPRGSADYQKLAALLALLDGTNPGTAPSGMQLFDGVRDQRAVDTLRDAALLFAGRLPTPDETSRVANGDDTDLKAVLLHLMQGPRFHDFLKDAANDRLFLRGNADGNLADDCGTCFPALNAEYWRLQEAYERSGSAADRRTLMEWVRRLTYSLVEAPLELIAYVVEHDRPYSEILTADYDMLTPLSNAALGGTAVFPPDAGPVDFRPGRVRGYYLRDPAMDVEIVPGAPVPRIIDPGSMRIDYPHVGVLNSKSFLSRYPTTATNRNRARARWTWFHFLGVDVEALAARTTDPVALADARNPTMNNPACAVCHSVLDPLAGAFQDYGDSGGYRTGWNGSDSLDRVYKTAAGSLYRPGDTWYADMREPGFDGTPAEQGNTLRWLAGRIAQDRRFATATVRFWWPAVMGAELLKAPEVQGDADYAARLAAYSAQQAEIEALTERFVRSQLALKPLLADMVLSRWFRTEGLDSSTTQAAQGPARSVAHLTGEKLLTPEQLARKTRALTGYNWNAAIDPVTSRIKGGLESDYGMFYGGIDGFALKTRARTLTPLMSNVAAAHALEAACPVVLGDFIRPDPDRLLFGGLSPWITPLTEASATQLLPGTGADATTLELAVQLQPGTKQVAVNLLNDACDFAVNAAQCRAAKNLVVGTISVRGPDGRVTTMTGSSATHGSCAAPAANGSLKLHATCTAQYPFTANVAGTYTITARVAAEQSVDDPVLAGVNIESDTAAPDTRGALVLKQKLVELHHVLLGHTLTIDSPELLASYDLLLQTWQQRRAGGFAPRLLGTARACNWADDIGFIATLPYPGQPLQTNGRYDVAAIERWLAPRTQDAMYMQQSWVVVMAYLLSHYDYLHE